MIGCIMLNTWMSSTICELNSDGRKSVCSGDVQVLANALIGHMFLKSPSGNSPGIKRVLATDLVEPMASLTASGSEVFLSETSPTQVMPVL